MESLIRFNINGISWSIAFVHPDDCVLMRTSNTYSLGVTDANLRTIFISDALKGRLLEKVITHEVTHSAMFSYGIIVDLETEELICNIVADYGYEICAIVDRIFNNIYTEQKYL